MISVEARNLLVEVAGPMRLGDNVKGMLGRAARRLNWPVSRVSNVYHLRARIIRAEEWIQLNQEAAALRDSARARREALHEIDVLLAAGKGAAKARGPAGSPRLEGDEGEPSLPLES